MYELNTAIDGLTSSTVFEKRAFARGGSSRAYKSICGKVARVVSSCATKEVLSLYHSGAGYFPIIERPFFNEKDNARVYYMPLYKTTLTPSSILNAESLAIYKNLRALYKNTDRNVNLFVNSHWQDAIANICDNEVIAAGLTEVFEDLANYQDAEHVFQFEISPRNIAAKEDGTIILLDVIYAAKALQRR